MARETKITPAMQQWCRALADPAVCRLVRRTVAEAPKWKQYRTEGPLRCAKPTWAMVDKLMAARLITWSERKPHESVAYLTALGYREATREVKAVTAAVTCWPFPVSAHAWEGVTSC